MSSSHESNPSILLVIDGLDTDGKRAVAKAIETEAPYATDDDEIHPFDHVDSVFSADIYHAIPRHGNTQQSFSRNLTGRILQAYQQPGRYLVVTNAYNTVGHLRQAHAIGTAPGQIPPFNILSVYVDSRGEAAAFLPHATKDPEEWELQYSPVLEPPDRIGPLLYPYDSNGIRALDNQFAIRVTLAAQVVSSQAELERVP